MCIHCPAGAASGCQFSDKLEIHRKGSLQADRWLDCDWLLADRDVPPAKKIRMNDDPEIPPHDQKESKDVVNILEQETFDFKTANAKYKAIDLLKRDLASEPALKHFKVEGWHPPKPLARKNYISSAELLPETPIGDQTW